MVSSSSKSNISLALGGAALAALGVAAYYKYSSSSGKTSKTDFSDIHGVTREQLSKLLDDIIANQKSMKVIMAEIQNEIVTKDLSFEDVCRLCERKMLKSPLEENSISVPHFSQLLQGYNNDPVIRSKIMQLTTSSSDGGSEKVKIDHLIDTYTIESIVDIHAFMLEKLQNTIRTVSISKKTTTRLATIAAQAYVGKLVHYKYGISCNELESLACHHIVPLSQDDKFNEIGTELRAALAKLSQMCTDESESTSEGTNAAAA